MTARTGRTLFAAIAIAASVPAASAADRVLSTETMTTALDVYVDGVLAERAAEIACSGDSKRTQWEDGVGQLIATLWANGVPDATVHDVETRLAAPPKADAAKPDCNDPQITATLTDIAKTGWPAQFRRMTEAVGMVVVAAPPTAAQFDAVKAVFAREAPAESRMLDCIAATQGVIFPVVLSDWTTTVIETGKMMVLAGLPRDEVVKLIATVDPATIWKKPKVEDTAALLKSCAADTAWQTRLYEFQTEALHYGVEEILKPKGAAPAQP